MKLSNYEKITSSVLDEVSSGLENEVENGEAARNVSVSNVQENGSIENIGSDTAEQSKTSYAKVQDRNDISLAQQTSSPVEAKDTEITKTTNLDKDCENLKALNGKAVEDDVHTKKISKMHLAKPEQVVQKPQFSFPSQLSSNKIKIESVEKPESTFIKVDYLKPSKTGKISVSRVLDFATEKIDSNCKDIQRNKDEHSESLKLEQPLMEIKTEVIPSKKLEKIPESPQRLPSSDSKKETSIKPETKKESGSSNKHSKSSSHHSSSSHNKSHSSSHHKSSSSSHRSRHSSSKECSRCYRRSKIKKNNIGIQVRPDEGEKPKRPTRPLEFEASHRVGVNRRSVVIDTNLSFLKYGRFYHIEVHPNGGASIVHMYQDELDTLTQQEMTELVDEFFDLTFSEDENGFAYHVMGVVHDGARYLPDLLEHMAENYSNLTVKSGVLGRNNDIETCTMLQYYDQVLKTYDEGTVRHGPLHQISLVGKVHEEVGGYFPDLLGKLEQSPFLKKAMPWGKLSIVQMDPRLSNDGPILWIRPGEQLIPTADLAKTPLKRQRRINELRNLQYLPRVSEARETMFEDRTKAHADHVGMGHERQTTAAVGKL